MLGIIRVNADSRTIHRLAAGTWDITVTRLVSKKRSGLSHSVPHGIWKSEFLEPLLHFRIQRRTAHDDHLEISAEGAEEFLTYLLKQQRLDSRDSGQDLHYRLLQDRLDGTLEHFLHDKRHSDEKVWLHVTHRRQKKGRRRSLAEEGDAGSVAERVEELVNQAVHVSHRQH